MNSLFKIVRKSSMKENIRRAFSTQETLIHIGSQKINYLKVGHGPKNIVCFPGAFGTIWSDFKPQIEGLDRKEFSIYVWEQPGHGKSRPPERKFTSKFLQEDADMGYNFIKAVGLKTFSLLGWSDGGTAGIILAAEHPELVDQMVIWGSCTYITPKDMEMYEKIEDIDSWSENMREPLIKLYGEKVLREMQKSIFEANREIVEKGGDISTTLLKDIKCPTLILHGAKDPLVVFEHPRYIHEHIQESKLYVFPDGKHNIHLRYPYEFNKMVTKFILEGH